MKQGTARPSFSIALPNAVTSDELYGYMTLAKDWKDGVLSIIMRGMKIGRASCRDRV
jgi:dynein heavy chain